MVKGLEGLMKYNVKKWFGVVAVALVAVASLSCNGGELTQNAAPVQLLVTNVQDLQQIDLEKVLNGETCGSVGTIEMQAIPKNSSVTGSFVDVRVTRYKVSYVRTDGGTQVPASFVRSIDTLITTGGASQSLTSFIILTPDALNQSPFVALRPSNGGRDPETNRTVIRMDVIVEVFGQTLGGDNVSGATRFPLDFCFHCQGCA